MNGIRFEFDSKPGSPYLRDELEILYVLSGRVEVSLAGGTHRLSQEDYFVFNPFEFHELYYQPGSHSLSAFIPMSILRQCGLGDVLCCSAFQPEQAAYHALIKGKLAAIFRDYLDAPEDRSLFIMSGVFSLLAVLKQQFEAKPVGDYRHLSAQERIRSTILYIGTHYAEDLSLREVAERTFISPGHLSRRFEQVVGMHFSDYLRMVRLSHAVKLLQFTDLSITEISERCGFQNVNTFISNFRAQYGETPGSARKRLSGKEEEGNGIGEIEAVHFVNLLKHAADSNVLQSLNKQYCEPLVIHANIGEKKNSLCLQHKCSMTIGYAKNYFSTGVPEALHRSIKDIGFEHVFLQGIFDDGMGVYRERADGTPVFDFTYLDMVLDDIVSTGAKPWLELSRTPEKMVADAREEYFGGFVQLPSDLEKWSVLVEAFLRHIHTRYGSEQTALWRFSIFPPFYVFYEIFTLQKYLQYYLATCKAIRGVCPTATVISGAFDVGLLRMEKADSLRRFLAFCRENYCMPDELGIQSFSIDYAKQSRADVESRIRRDQSGSYGEPAPPVSDPDILRHDLDRLQDVLEECGYPNLPICYVYWNSTIWDSDLGNDTCYKAAYIVKNVLENAGRTTALNYSHSLLDHGRKEEGIFAGKSGAMTEGGIPKAAYHAFRFLSRMGDTLLAQGDGYTISCSQDEIQILLYHYCHYDLDAHLDQFLPREEQLTIDRYFGFHDPGVRSVNLYLSGLEAGNYSKESFIINREQGSSYDIWRKIGAPKVLSSEQSDYLEKVSEPGYRYETIRVSGGEELMISTVLDSHEVQMIILKKNG